MTQKVITPTKGICNTIPDMICQDNELADSLNIEFRDEALRPIQDLKVYKNFNGALMCVHHLNNGDKVYIQNLTTDVQWTRYNKSDTASSGYLNISNPLSAQTVGNTLILNTANGLEYFLWKSTKYEPLGNMIPIQDFQVGMNFNLLKGYFTADPIGTDGIVERNDEVFYGVKDKDAYKDMVVALWNNADNKARDEKHFTQPFLVTSAVELYDGTYTHMSAPVLMYPSIQHNHTAFFSKIDNEKAGMSLGIRGMTLSCLQRVDFSDWRDIVKSITVFVSEQIPIHETELTDVYFQKVENDINWNGIDKYGSYVYNSDSQYRVLKEREEQDIVRDIAETSVFYKLCALPITAFGQAGTLTDISGMFDKHTLRNLSTQPTLSNLDYYSLCPIYTDKPIISYNRRLNLHGVKRGFFQGFTQFMPYHGNEGLEAKEICTLVTINTQEGKKEVRFTFHTTDIFNGDCSWFYYPDPRAVSVNINGTVYYLKEHSGLNGAYYIKGLPKGNEKHITGATWSNSLPEPEYLQNFLLQSGVDNPFYFPAGGYVRVGQGEIIGMAGLTTALSQDAYKVATTIVFTTQGIWALQISSDGQYSSVPPPFSREVCSNPESITMIDNGVFFVSERGLMLITDNGINCISEQLKGKFNDADIDFLNYIKDAKIAYDYKNNSIWIINRSKQRQMYAWVYNLKQGTYARKEFKEEVLTTINDYPDTLIQTEGNTYTMLYSPDRFNDKKNYSGHVITRPLNFDEAIRLKSIRDIKHIQDCENKPEMTIYASNDCKTWNKINSIKGRGFKFFKFEYIFTNIGAMDSLAGTIVTYETRQENKVR